MKLKNYFYLIIVLIFSIFTTNAQNKNLKPNSNRGIQGDVNFVTRIPGAVGGKLKVKGDVTLIGNTIIGRATTAPIFAAGNPIPTNLAVLTAQANTPYNGNGRNNDFNFEYIDIDSDASTFSSSSADLVIRNLQGTNECVQVAYAGLYWAGSYAFTRSTDPDQNNVGTPALDDWNKVKLKLPTGGYIDITVDKNNANVDVAGQEDQVIVRDVPDPTSDLTIGAPYVCYKNITNLIKQFEKTSFDNTANGTYTLANMRSGLGDNRNGISSGWNMVIVYTHKSLPSKFITIFDGFKYIQAGSPSIDFNISGFETVPAPFPVRARIGVAGLEGDNNGGNGGDQFQFTSPIGNTSFYALRNVVNDPNDFFNSTISTPTTTGPFAAVTLNRNPNSKNTLGFDVDLVDIDNPSNNRIANGATDATVRFPSAGDDTYSAYLLTFAVDIIEPKIILTKTIRDVANAPIAQNSVVTLGQVLTYNITYQNVGNDNAVNFTLKDVLPNLNFVTLQSVEVPVGVTYTNTPSAVSAGDLLFTIPNSQVIKNSPSFYTIKIVVKVTSDKNVFLNACSNIIKNTASAKYAGELNETIVNDNSISSNTNCLDEASSTNIIVLNTDTIIKSEQLCGSTLTLTAPDGYTSYTWTNLATGATVIATSQTYVVTNVTNPLPAFDSYNVFCNIAGPCYPINVQYNVTLFDVGYIPNPVIPFSNYQLNACESGTDPAILPIINLCGNVKRLISPTIANATFTWKKLEDGSCPDIPLCHAENPIDGPPCVWNIVGTANTFEVELAGEYRVRILFQGGCERTFYFKVFKSNLTLEAEVRNISCDVTGRIIASGLAPSGYVYSINGGPYGPSPVFEPLAEGPYTVSATLAPIPPATTGLPGACVYTKNVFVQNISSSFLVSTVVTQPLCKGDNGSIQVQISGAEPLQISGAEPQFSYKIFRKVAGVVVTPALHEFGPTNNVTYNSPQLPAGIYIVNGSNRDGCKQDKEVEIKDPQLLTLTAGLTTAVTCQPGLITLTTIGGTGPFTYTYNGGTPTTSPTNQIVIPVPVPNTGAQQTLDFSIEVTDFNNCKADTVISVVTHPEPVVTATKKDVFCYGNNSGEIEFKLVSNTGGYILSYGYNGPTGAFQSSNLFTGLAAGTYKPIIRYSYPAIGNVNCFIELPVLIITEPTFGLIAVAGVSELAGCGPGNTGKVRITNPQGGTPYTTGSPYLYYFAPNVPPALPNPFLGTFSTVGSQTVNEAFLPVGCHTIYIQDASGCSFPMNVCIDPPPTPPTLQTPITIYNCDGTATSTVIVNSNGGNFTYEYFLNNSTTPNPGPNSNIFTNVPCSATVQSIRVNYTAINIPTFSDLLIENFGSGNNTISPGINPAYCFERQIAGLECQNSLLINDGDYAVTNVINPTYVGAWTSQAKDHTNPLVPGGRFLCVNIGGTAGIGGILYSKKINSIIPGQNIKVSLWYMNLLILGNTQPNPNLTIQLVKDLGLPSQSIIATQDTGDIPKTEAWINRVISLNPLTNTSLDFVIRSNNNVTSGNDVIIDDIKVFQEPKACATSTIFPINIPCSAAFAAQVTLHTDVKCSGGNNGTVTIAAQNFKLPYGFDYSINGGTTWINSQVSPVTITNTANPLTGIPAGTLTILVRFDNTSLPCTKTLTQLITSPPVLTASAVDKQATCLVGASILASATGGVGPYTYQLEFAAGGIVPGQAFPHAALFSPVAAGSYIVKVRDANLCPDDINIPVIIDLLPVLTASLSTTSDLCYDPINQATIIVTAAGGTAPFQYAISPAFVYGASTTSTTASFNVAPGTYTIKVSDSNSCEVTVGPVVITPQLTVGYTLVKDLDCSASPNAEYTINIAGGYYPSYSYQVKFNAGGFLPAIPTPIVGTSFLFTASSGAGTYIIRITDAKGCTAQTPIVVDDLVPVTATTTQLNVLCNGSNTGSFTISPSGGTAGTAGYLVQFNNPSGAFLPNNFSHSGLVAGTYTYVVKDSKNCTFAGSVVITDLFPPLLGAPQVTQLTIPGGNCGGIFTPNGKICFPAITGGKSGYTITMTGGTNVVYPSIFTATGIPTVANPMCYENLNIGNYIITITDANNCSVTYNVTITGPITGLNINPFIIPTTDCLTGGCIKLIASGPLLSLTDNLWFALVKSDPAPLYYVGSPDFQAATNPGILPTGDPLRNESIFCGLIPGKIYQFTVYSEANQCYFPATATAAVQPFSPFVSTVTPNNVSCFGGTDGSVNFTFSNYSSASVTYQIFRQVDDVAVGLPVTINTLTPGGPTQSVNNFGLLAPGICYYILFIENGGTYNGCKTASPVFCINQATTALTLTTLEVKKDACSKNIGVASGTGNGGSGGYKYRIFTQADAANPAIVPLNIPINNATYLAWLNNPLWTSSSTFSGYAAGNYVIFVKDSNNCVVSQPVSIGLEPALVLDPLTVNQCTDVTSSYTITAVANGGFGIIKYLATSASPSPNITGIFSFSIPSVATLVRITVIDENGCTDFKEITVYPSLGINAVISKQPTCALNDGEVIVTGIGGNSIYAYSIVPNAGITPTAFGFTGLAQNITYTIRVDNIATGCFKTTTVTPAIPSVVTLAAIPFTKVDVKCAGDNTGSFVINLAPQTATVNNNPPYTYTITQFPVGALPIANINSFSGLIAGDYIVRIISFSNCFVDQTVRITQPNPLIVPAPIVVQASCPANSNVSSFAEITSPLAGAGAVSGGIAPYSYQFSEGTLANVVQPFGSDNSHTVTSAIIVPTKFFLTVKDANGCIISSTAVTVIPFTKLETVNVVTNQLITCAPGSLQNITVTVVTNPAVPAFAPNLTYTVSSIPAGFTVSNNTGIFNGANGLPIGNYLIKVKNNDTNCELQGAVYYVNNPNTFQANVTNIINLTCFNSNNGSASITIVDNIINANDLDNAGAFSYTITRNGIVYGLGGNSPNAGPFAITGLPAGNYVVSATLTSTPFCIVPPTSFTITQPTELQIIAIKSADVTCRNIGNVGEGAINVTVSGGVAPYLVNVIRTAPGVAFNYGNFAPGNITGLIAGTYSVTITDGTTPVGCTKPSSIVILAPQAPISAGTLSSNLVNNRLICYDDKKAQITVSGLLGGQPSSYQYTLNNITNPLAIISNGPQQSPVFNLTGTGYGAGTYTVSVQDGYGCGVYSTLPIIITEPTEILPLLSNSNPIDCNGIAGLVLFASGGTPPYFYSETAGGTFTQFPIATPLSVSFIKGTGTYKYFVKDANGCLSLVSNPVIVPPTPVLIIKTVKSTDITCVSLTSGTITAVAEGGFDFNYVYTLYSSATGAPINPLNTSGISTGEFTGLPTGNYWVGVTSGGSCVSALKPISIAPQLNFNVSISKVDVTCKGKNNGILNITITGAIGQIQYIINPSNPIAYKPLNLISGSLTNYQSITGLEPDTYVITIQDTGVTSNGLLNCPFTTTFTIAEPLLLNYTATTNLVQASCTGDVTGSGTINIILGTGTAPYRIFTVDGSTTFTATNPTATTFVVTGLTGGVHSVVVLDKNDCEVIIPINLDPSVTIDPRADVKYLCPNPANNTNTVTVSVDPALLVAGSGNVQTYSLDGGAYQSSPIFQNVAPGVHFIDVKNEASYTSPARTSTCIKRINNINVRFIDPLAVTLTNGNLNEIIAITTGGTAPYNHDFNGVNTGTIATYSFPQTDKYFVTVTDKAGCTLTVSKTFTFIDIFIPNFFSPDGDGNNDGWSPQNTYNYKNLIFYVFDRFGRKIGTFNEGQIWDGKYDGQELPSGDYWYLVKPDGANDGKEYVGNFSLYR